MQNFALTKRPNRHAARNCRTDNFFIGRQFLDMENVSARKANSSFSRIYLDPKYSRWMSCDPAVGDYMSQTEKGEGGIYNLANLNVYHYSANNPIKYTDPDGEALHVAIGAAIGALANTAINYGTQVAKNLMNGEGLGAALTNINGAELAGAAAGGAAAGAILAATGNTTLANAAAGAVGAATGNATKQGINMATGKQEGFDAKDFAVETGVGAALGGGLKGQKIQGITKGQGSMQAVQKQISTKLANGTIKNVTAKTSAKMAASRIVNGTLVEGSVLATPAKAGVDKAIDKVTGASKPETKQPEQ